LIATVSDPVGSPTKQLMLFPQNSLNGLRNGPNLPGRFLSDSTLTVSDDVGGENRC